MTEIDGWIISYYGRQISKLNDFNRLLKNRDLFDRDLFQKGILATTLSKKDWAKRFGVSYGTLRNWETGNTYPNKQHRKIVLNSCQEYVGIIEDRVREFTNASGSTPRIDSSRAEEDLSKSILRASPVDFIFDSKRERISATPFKEDTSQFDDPKLAKRRDELKSALSSQAKFILSSLEDGANTNVDGLRRILTAYASHCDQNEEINPRLLNMWGSTVKSQITDESVQSALGNWTVSAVDQFVDSHTELMRVFYQEAMAAAQELQKTPINEDEPAPTPDQIEKVANQLENLKQGDDEPVFDRSVISSIIDLKDDISRIDEALQWTHDKQRREKLRAARVQAVKNSVVTIGRLLIFSALFASIPTATPTDAVGFVGGLFAIIDSLAPGTIRHFYEQSRKYLPFLPEFPDRKEK